MSRGQLVAHVKQALGLPTLMVAAPNQLSSSDSGGSVSGDKPLARLALCAGSGGDLVGEALAQGADVFLTGEMRHHDALAAAAKGLTVVATLHSNSERGAMGPYADMIRKRAPQLDVRVSTRDSDPFSFE
jgi:putative NIF3 family GTP cyclohydrolase 1 type 2